MELTEIVNRKSPMTYTLEEQVYVIEQYIKERKGQTIKCNPFKPLEGLPPHIASAVGTHILKQVNSAFNDAVSYYLNK